MKRLIASFKRKDKDKGCMKLEKITCAFLIVTLIIAFTVPFSLASPEQTKIYVDPPRIIDSGISPSQNITVDIMVANVTDLFAWQVKIYYNATILNATEVSLPPNHVFAGQGYMPVTPVINNTEGYVWFGVSLLWMDPMWTFNGTGVLCQIRFRAKDRGATPLNFSPYGEGTELFDEYLGNLVTIPASTEDGFYEYKYAPTADFTIAPDFPIAEQSVTFNASSSYDVDGTIVNYTWDFDDGNITTVTSPVIIHQYVAAGNYTIRLTATDNDNLTNTKTSVVRVRDYPTAAFVYSPSVPDVGSSVTFDASSSVPNGGVILYYLWDFGDGSSLTNTTNTVTTHVFNAFGNYTITLTVTDNEGLSNSYAETVIVEAQPEGILLYAVIIMVLAAIVIVAAIVIYYKRIRKHKSRTV